MPSPAGPAPVAPRPRAGRRRPLVLLLGLALVAAACVRGESSSDQGAGPGDGDDAPTCPVGAHLEAGGTVEVEVWHGLGSEAENALEAIADDYNASQDQVRVEVQNQGASFDEVLRKYVAAIPSGQLPAIAYLEGTALRQIIDSGTILPASACEEVDEPLPAILPAVRNYYTAEDAFWPAYPNVGAPILYYNANHFRQAGLDPDDPPETLDELREAARALKDAGIPAPLALILNSAFVESWINGAGASVVNNDNGRSGLATESTFDNPTTHEVYTWIQEMAEEGLLEGHSATAGQINQYLAVAQQNSSMVIETSTAATTIRALLGGDVDPEEEGVDVGEVDLSALVPAAGPFPGLDRPAQVRVSSSAFFLSDRVSDAEIAGAWDFMRFMWEVDSQVAWHLQGGYLPTTEEVASSPEVVEYWEDDVAGQLLRVAYDQLVAIDPERPGPQIGPDVEYADAIKNSLDRLVLQGESVEDTIARADREIQAALERYAEDNSG